MNKEQTLVQVQRIIELCGKRRFKKMFSIYSKNPQITGDGLWYKYELTVSDCWESMVFSDRLSKSGFYRNAPNPIGHFMARFIEVMNDAKKCNLI